MTLLNLACGLDLDEIENPLHILSQLAADLSDNTNSNAGELVELANPASEQAAAANQRDPQWLPSLVTNEPHPLKPIAVAFKCRCPKLSVDQQRSRYCSRVFVGIGGGEGAAEANNNGPTSRKPEAQRERQPLCFAEELRISMAQDDDDNDTHQSGKGFIASSPSVESQLGEFGPVNRNSVAKRMARRWFRLYGRDFNKNNNNNTNGNSLERERTEGGVRFQGGPDVASLSLYKIEEFLLEANDNLAKALATETRRSSLVLSEILQTFVQLSQAQIAHEMLQEQACQPQRRQPVPVVMIRAPLLNVRSNVPATMTTTRRSRRSRQRSSRFGNGGWRRDSGIDLDCDRDSGLDLDLEEGCEGGEMVGFAGGGRRIGWAGKINSSNSLGYVPTSGQQLTLVEELFEFRSDVRVQTIVRQSVELFGKLIDESPLFRLINSNNSNNNLFNSQELKLYACIECQRLRSTIRFQWITQCLLVAFSGPAEQLVEAASELNTNSPNNKLLTNELKPQRIRKAEDIKQTAQWSSSGGGGFLPPIEAHKLEDLARLRYFDSLALLMGNLLRQHFLVPALDRWRRLLEAHQTLVPGSVSTCLGPTIDPPSQTETITNKPKLGIQVDLVELDNSSSSSAITTSGGGLEPFGAPNLPAVSASGTPPTLLASSKPEEELKETLGFVVDELASVCRRLPRLETQLESEALFLDASSGTGSREGDKFILSLEAEDNSLVEAKSRLGHLIDCSNLPLATEANFNQDTSRGAFNDDQFGKVRRDLGIHPGCQPGNKSRLELVRGRGSKWVNSDYLRIIELVNNFRQGVDTTPWSGGGALSAGNVPSVTNELDDVPDLQNDDDEDADDRLHRLQACCRQIRLLDSLEEQLICRLNRHHDHGFVLLDYGPLRDSLLKCIHKERLLLIRLHLDELLRLMDRLRLHFEEIEFGVDLESAIEDYLADRRQWKQSQHQQALMGDDDVAPGDQSQYLHPMEPPGPGDDDSGGGGGSQGHHLQAETGAVVIKQQHQIESNHLLLQIAGDKDNGCATTETGDNDDDNNNNIHRDTDEFVEAITQGHANEGHKLLALGAAADRSLTTDSEERRVVPIIECQLLVARYEFMSNLLVNELKSLANDIRVAFEGGLVFLSEFVGHDQLDPSHWQLITELAVRSSDFRPMLSHSLARLKLARTKLANSNELRSQVLSRLTLEFHQLFGELGARFLACDESGSSHHEPPSLATAESGGGAKRAAKKAAPGKQQQQQQPQQAEAGSHNLNSPAQRGGRRIVQLDTIQETAAWAGELELRFRFLWQQNALLAREANLLQFGAKLLLVAADGDADDGCRYHRDSLLLEAAKATGDNGDGQVEEEEEDGKLWRLLGEAGEARASVLERWRPLVGLVANLWRLIEEYETQQVKWLNSDTKRIDFSKMDSTFRLFQQRLNSIRDDESRLVDGAAAASGDWLSSSLKHNLQELDGRFGRFAGRRLPLFKFLTNKYLTDEHWERVNEILQGGQGGGGDSIYRPGGFGANLAMFAGPPMAPQACTTLAQFLELNAERHVEELEKISREAIIEQELTNFLLSEVGCSLAANDRYLTSGRRAQLKALDMSGAWFVGWTEKQLVMAAGRFIEAKRREEEINSENCILEENLASSEGMLAAKLVACHSMVKRHLKLRYTIGLDSLNGNNNYRSEIAFGRPEVRKGAAKTASSPVTLRTCKQLTSPELVTPSLFVEFLRLFTVAWLRGRSRLATRLGQLQLDRTTINGHLAEIESLVDQANGLRETDLRLATSEGEATLVGLERESVRLEIEREILATMESLALERQREALGKRDKCIRQITERAIPAIRAATRALDCLDARSFKTLRYVRPNPPEAVRLVLEAVCLLRSCAAETTTPGNSSSGSSSNTSGSQWAKPMEPERHFDALSGRIREDYWQPACRMLNGTHSSKFLADLRRVDRRRMPAQVMRLIRRRYLSSSKFQPALIGRVSPECGLLARWLIAVDVFDRVINVVRPNYGNYLESERQLAGLLAEVNNRRAQIESIGLELQRMEEALEGRVGLKMSLADSLDQCCDQLKRIELTRRQLVDRRQEYGEQLDRLGRQQSRLANRCLMRAAKTVYLDAMRPDECRPMANLLRLAIQAADGGQLPLKAS